MSEEKKQLTYADAGVDIDAGNRAVELMKDSVRASYRPEVIGDLGGFGGLFALDTKKYKEPILVSGTDGVGTKLKFAFLTNNHSTIGQDHMVQKAHAGIDLSDAGAVQLQTERNIRLRRFSGDLRVSHAFSSKHSRTPAMKVSICSRVPMVMRL